ncbi:MAG TPA: shikimate kinase [Microbacterium sp.]|uniref:shikimate kinase n=1 Tax=Microbacterium sp. TaxID=51671 RepID=UPI002C3E0232|nr:shikimate kinase [Microbacterium sp.]HWI31718.1 shikimate kinase [Microbacterium sp.]
MTGDSRAIVLIGPMGAGKSSVGRRVAKALRVGFFDTDVAIIKAHGPIPDLFRSHGEPHFRALERQAVIDGLATGGVVALGGGAVLDPATRADLARHRVVLLTVAPRVVAARLRDTSRPLLQGEDPMATWTRISEERAPLYAEVADVTFDTSTGPLSEVTRAIVAWAAEVGTHE